MEAIGRGSRDDRARFPRENLKTSAAKQKEDKKHNEHYTDSAARTPCVVPVVPTTSAQKQEQQNQNDKHLFTL